MTDSDEERGVLGYGEDEVKMLILCHTLQMLGIGAFIIASLTGVLAAGVIATALVLLGMAGLIETYNHYRKGAFTELLTSIKDGTWSH